MCHGQWPLRSVQNNEKTRANHEVKDGTLLARFAVMPPEAAAKRTPFNQRKPRYQPRDPPSTIVHQVVREHIDEFISYTEENYKKPLPRYVKREFEKYLPCGDPTKGFARVRCSTCSHEYFVP